MLQGHSWHYMVPHACSARTGLGPVLQSMYSKCFVLTTRFCQHRCHATDETAAACIDRGSLDSSQALPPLLGRSRAEPQGKEAACDTAHPLAALTPALLTPPPSCCCSEESTWWESPVHPWGPLGYTRRGANVQCAQIRYSTWAMPQGQFNQKCWPEKIKLIIPVLSLFVLVILTFPPHISLS